MKSVQFDNALHQDGYTSLHNAVLLNPRLSIGARWTYAALSSYAWRSEQVWPGQVRLALQAGADERSIRRWLAELRDCGLIEITSERRPHGRHNVYTLLTEVPASYMDDYHEALRSIEEPDTSAGPPPEEPDTSASPMRTPAPGKKDKEEEELQTDGDGQPSSASETDFALVEPPAPEPDRLFDAKSDMDRKIDDVWSYYCEVSPPVNPELSPARKRMLRSALKEASVEECKLAIDGNRASSWHRERNKHNLSDIFRPGKDGNLRAHLDRFIRDAQSQHTRGPVLSVDRGKVQQHKENVVKGVQPGASEHAQELAESSTEWLEKNGWTVTIVDNWPRFTESSGATDPDPAAA